MTTNHALIIIATPVLYLEEESWGRSEIKPAPHKHKERIFFFLFFSTHANMSLHRMQSVRRGCW